MSLLFDQNISFRVAKNLQDLYPGCVHVSDVGLSNTKDNEIWNFAKREKLAIVTFDSDFYDISLINGHPPKIIWIRSLIQNSRTIIALMRSNQDAVSEFLHNSMYASIACLEIG